MVQIVHRHHIHFRKHNGRAKINYLNAFINLFGHQGEIRNIYQKCTVNSEKLQQPTYDPKSLMYKFHAIWISIAISTKMTSCIGLFQQKQFSLVKSVKQQISYFSYFHPSTITLCKNLHDHKLCTFTPFIFTRNQQLIKVKQEDHIPSIPTVGLAFFLARACQHKPNKIGITCQPFPSSSYAFYKI